MRFNILIIMLFFCSMLNAQTKWEDFTILANNIGESSLSKSQIKSAFKGYRSRWINDEDVIVVLPSSKHPNKENFAKLIFSSEYKSVKKYWLSIVFQGRANPPVYLDSDDEILDFIKRHPGSIGLINKTSSQYNINVK
jgi:ABC-type phosphate transport system substrate-binding protein